MKTKMKSYSNMVKCKLAFTGHAMRGSSGKLILTVLKGKINGKKEDKGRKWIDDIILWLNEESYRMIKSYAQQREMASYDI